MAELIELPSVPPDHDSLEVLESVARKVRAGEISSVAIACVYRDGKTGDTWSDTSVLPSLIGAVGILHAKLTSVVTRKAEE